MKTIDQVITDDYALYLGDSAQILRGLPDKSIGYSIFSPPFADLYTYSNSEEDMGNSRNYDEFFVHFDFIISELFRIMMNGRNISIHCMDLPTHISREGFVGLRDFPGDIIRAFEKRGFIYHSRVTIWKNPLIAATRTKALGLMHKQLCKDSSISRQGIADTIITMRKHGENEEPISHGDGFREFIGETEPTERGIKYSHEVWRRYASPVWMDINQSDTLNFRIAREAKDEKHICPLQMQVIERCVELWSNPRDICLSPFGGIGSEPYVFIKKDRRAIAIELKRAYYEQMVKNVREAVRERDETTLFCESVKSKPGDVSNGVVI